VIAGVIPAAGRATRLQPLQGSKEMLLVGGRPVIDHVAERMWAAPAEEIRVVTRADKHDLVEHAGTLGARVIQGEPGSVAESVSLGLPSLEADDIVLLGFPDTLWEPVDGFARLVEALGDADAALGLFRTPDLARSDVVVVGHDGLVREILVKPDTPPSELVWGCAAVRRGALDGLESYAEPGHLLGELAKEGRVRGVHLSDSWLDVGTKDALARARGVA
jgi:glucose-1-phosphate thymidylyltransferase